LKPIDSRLTSYVPRKAAPPLFEHQWEALAKGGNKFSFALLMEAGTAKTRIIIDNIAWLYRRNIITAALVAAPNDVADQWVNEQLPLYLPEDIQLRAVVWDPKSVRTERLAKELSSKPLPNRLHVLAMNHEAFSYKRSRAIARAFLKAHKSFFVLDESHEFRIPKSLRTRAIRELGPHAVVRRILTGTPFEKVFDLYSQFAFLDERILGFTSFLAFKHHYGIFTKEYTQKMIFDRQAGRKVMKLIEYETLQEYQRLDELYTAIEPFCYRKKLSECTDLPEKLYITIPTHLSEAQSALYQEIKETGMALLAAAEAGKPIELLDLALLNDEDLIDLIQSKPNKVSAVIKLVINLRLQQCMGGFVTDDAKTVRCTEGKPYDIPRIQATVRYTNDCLNGEAKVIVWAQFRAELEALFRVFIDQGIPCHMIHGGVTGAARSDIIAQFKDPKHPVRVLVAHPNTMGTGQNLQVARSLIYYSNGWRWIKREQSERRAHRLGQTGTVRIGDLQAKDAPLDKRLLENFAQKGELVNAMMSWNLEEL
jgi:SNF2 family DNA or RNA helicase